MLSTKAEIEPKLNPNSKPQGGAGTTPRCVYLNASADGRKPTLATSQGQKAGNPYAAEARVRKYPLAHSPRGMTGGAGANPRHGGDGRRPTLTPPQLSQETGGGESLWKPGFESTRSPTAHTTKSQGTRPYGDSEF